LALGVKWLSILSHFWLYHLGEFFNVTGLTMGYT